MSKNELYKSNSAAVKLKTEMGGKMVLSATNVSEVKSTMGLLKKWCILKVLELKAEVKELTEEVKIAKKNKWRTAPLKRQHKRAVARLNYYEKFKAAVNAGYHPVPNIPGATVIAIRTSKKHPKGYEITKWKDHWDLEQRTERLPKGEGEYVDPFPVAVETTFPPFKDDLGIVIQRYGYTAHEFRAPEFPMALAKSNIMEATGDAMARKIFDRIALVQGGPSGKASTRRADPLVVGVLVDPRSLPGYEKSVSFIIGWCLNLEIM